MINRVKNRKKDRVKKSYDIAGNISCDKVHPVS